jgi:hypothetical protein
MGEPPSGPFGRAPWELSNKDEEGGDGDGREYNHEQHCIEQIPNGKILIFCCRWVGYLPLGSPGFSSHEGYTLKLATQGKVVNIALKSFDFAALPRNGDTPKISCRVLSTEPCE